jgi:methylmalonyl-CoA mutase N-terminal domain/subunit
MLTGAYEGIRRNFYQREIANSSYLFQQEVEAKEQVQVAVNDFTGVGGCTKPKIIKISEEVAQFQMDRLKQVKSQRDNLKAQDCLQRVVKVAKSSENLIPYILDAVKAYCSVGEIMDSLRSVWGIYKEDSIF